MKKIAGQSEIKFFGIRISYTNEPLWYRILVLLILTGVVIFIICILKNGYFKPEHSPNRNYQIICGKVFYLLKQCYKLFLPALKH